MTSELMNKAATAVTLAVISLSLYRRSQNRKRRQRIQIPDLPLSKGQDGRKLFRLAVVDDEVDERFPQSERDALFRRGFDIKYFKDIHNIEELAPYHIVLCDIRGVGRELAIGEHYHGGIIVQELRRYHPLSYIVIYSSQLYNPEFNRYFRIADATADKGRLTGEPLVEVLDTAIDVLNSPGKQWARLMRNILGEREQLIAPRTLERLHQRFFSQFADGSRLLSNQLGVASFDGNEMDSGDGAIDATRDAAEIVERLFDLLR